MIYYLYNNYRESILQDINSRIRTEAILCEKIKLNEILKFNIKKINKNDLLIITSCSIPSTRQNFKTDDKKSYNKLILSFNKKLILFEDIHYYTYKNYSNLFLDLKHYKIKYGVSMYNCEEWNYIKQNYNWNKTFILNHHYDSDTFYNMNLKKNIDILFYGDINSHYPLRQKIFKILKRMKKFNIKIIPRPPYFTKNIDSVIEHRKELSKLINKSHICIATCSKYNYFVCKYLEIVASNSIFAGNIESIGKKFFKNNFVKLSLNMNDNEIEQTIVNALKNKQCLKKMNENVYENIFKFSIQNNYWDNLNIIINKIMS